MKYTYDILGRRVQKLDYYGSPNNPTTTIYIYAGDNIISEYKTIGVATGSGGTGTLTPLTLQKNYINSIGTDALLAYDAEEQLTSTGLTKTTNRYYYHLNQLGSVVALSSSTGSILMRYSYDSFGYPRIIQGSGTGTTLVDFRNYPGNKYSNLRLWTGREHDRETGYYYHRARYSFPELMGRFISRDPIGQNDQVNLYTYVRNSPLMGTDRDGKKASQLIANTWNTYLNGSQKFGSYMYDNCGQYQDDIVGTIDRTRKYSGNVGLAATPFLFTPAAPIAAGIIGITGGMALGAGALESYLTQDMSFIKEEAFSAGVGKIGGKFVQNYLKNAGAVTKVEFNTNVGRYMGQYTTGAYGFIKNEVGQASIIISQGSEQIFSLMTQKLSNN